MLPDTKITETTDGVACINKFEKAKTRPDSERAMKTMDGGVHLWSGEYEKAFMCFVEAGRPRSFIPLARAALEKGLTAIALLSFEFSGIQPSERETQIIRGDVSLGSGDLMDARRCYEKAGARSRLRNLGLHALRKGYALIALDCYEKAGSKPPEDELENFIDSYVENIDQRIKTRKHIGVREVCYALKDKERLRSIGRLLICKGEILLGIYFWEDSGKKFPNETLMASQKAKLIAQGDRIYRNSIRIDHCFYRECIKAYAVAGAKDRLEGMFDQCLEEEELEHAIDILKALYGEPLRKTIPDEVSEKIFSYAKTHFQKGEFREGMRACDAIGRRPPKKELYECGEKCLFDSDEKELFMLAPEVFREGLKSYMKAGLRPSNAKIVAAGYRFLDEGLGFCYYARQAFEEAFSAEHLLNLIKYFEKINAELLKEKEDPQKSEDWISNINKKDLDEEIKKSLIQMRKDSFDTRIGFNKREICEIREAIKRIENIY